MNKLSNATGGAASSADARLYGLRPEAWLLIAAALYTGISIFMYTASLLNWFPLLSGSNGRWHFSPDSGDTMGDATLIANLFRDGHWSAAWDRMTNWRIGSPGRIYALGCLIFGDTMLATIPCNALIYMAILCTTFAVAKHLWDRRTAFWAALMVAVWPSILLHMTQPLKDPIYLLGQLLFLYGAVLAVDRHQRWQQVFRWTFIVLIGYGLSSMVRPQTMGINCLVWSIVVGAFLVSFRPKKRESLLKYAVLIGLWCIFIKQFSVMMAGSPWAAAVAPALIQEQQQQAKALEEQQAAIAAANAAAPEVTVAPVVAAVRQSVSPPGPRQIRAAYSTLWRLLWKDQQQRLAEFGRDLKGLPRALLTRLDFVILKIAYHRFEWTGTYYECKSNIDTQISLDQSVEVIGYLPRAAQIGLFAPFPTMWFNEGRRVGRIGRLASGLEMSAIYALVPLALLALFRARRRLAVWVVASFVALGATSLGLLVTNLGALYRMRFAFWLGLFILAVGGIRILLGRFPAPPTPPAKPTRRIRVLRILTRANVGGPALHATLLTNRLDPLRYESWLAVGRVNAEEGDYLAWQSCEKGRLIQLPSLKRALDPLADLESLGRVFLLIRRLRPDIVHTHTAKAGTIGRVAAWLAGVPVVVHTYHGHVLRGYFPPGKERLFIWIEQLLSRITTRLVAVSDSVRNELVGLGIGKPEQYSVIPLGLDIERYLGCDQHRGQLRQELGIAANDPLIGMVARLTAIKRHEDLMLAAREVVDKLPDARFLLVGDGEERAELEQLACEYNLEKNVRFLGWRNDLDRIYADCDLVILTSANEGLPVSLIEAMAAGRAVVATRVGGVPDLVQHGSSGLLVEAADQRALAESILKMLNDPGSRSRMGTVGQARVVKAYRAERLLGDIDRLYEQLVTREQEQRSLACII